MKRTISFVLAFLAVLLVSSPTFAQGFNEKRRMRAAAVSADSSKTAFEDSKVAVVEIPVNMTRDQAYELVTNSLNKQNVTIDNDASGNGVIYTTLKVQTGRMHDSGWQTKITLVSESKSSATIRVAAIELKKNSALSSANPWNFEKNDQGTLDKIVSGIKTETTAAATSRQ